MPLSPRAIAVSMALICDWVSPSALPVATDRWVPDFFDSFWAASFMEMK